MINQKIYSYIVAIIGGDAFAFFFTYNELFSKSMLLAYVIAKVFLVAIIGGMGGIFGKWIGEKIIKAFKK